MAGLGRLLRWSALRSIRRMRAHCWWVSVRTERLPRVCGFAARHRGRSFSTGEGGTVAIDQTNPRCGTSRPLPGSAFVQCANGAACTAANFTGTPTIGPAQVSGDDSLIDAPWLLDPALSSEIAHRHLPGVARTCRQRDLHGLRRMRSARLLGGPQNASCASTNPVVRSLAAGGPASNATAAQNAGSEVLYAGMAGALDGGGSLAAISFLSPRQTPRATHSVERSRDIAGDEWAGRGLQPRRFRYLVSRGGPA